MPHQFFHIRIMIITETGDPVIVLFLGEGECFEAFRTNIISRGFANEAFQGKEEIQEYFNDTSRAHRTILAERW